MTPTICPDCNLPIGSDDPFDDCCACWPDATDECWNCGSRRRVGSVESRRPWPWPT